MDPPEKNSPIASSDSSNDDSTKYISSSNSSQRRVVKILVPISVIGLGVLILYLLNKNPPDEEIQVATKKNQKRELRTRVIELKKENYQTTIEANGIIKAHNEIILTSQVSGRVVTIHPQFEDGAFFKKGAILLELEEADFLTSVASAKANLAQAEAAHAQEKARSEQAKLNWEDLGYDEEPNDLVLRLPQLKEAVARVNSAQTQLAQAERNLSRSKIKAPFDGRVIQRSVGISQAISATTMLGRVFSVDYAEVRLPINSTDMRNLELPENPEDEPLKITLADALDDENSNSWKAEIVRTEGTIDQNSLELFAIARIHDPFGINSGASPLRIGQPVSAMIPGNVLENVFRIPRKAVRRLKMIYLINPDTFTIQGITIDPVSENEDYVFINDQSIKEGTFLATTPMSWVPEGAKVEIIKEETVLDDETNDNKPSSKSPSF